MTVASVKKVRSTHKLFETFGNFCQDQKKKWEKRFFNLEKMSERKRVKENRQSEHCDIEL